MSKLRVIKLKNAKRNCFAYKEGGCQATINETCSNCKFFKTLEQVEEKNNFAVDCKINKEVKL